jgi:hypothetical protein
MIEIIVIYLAFAFVYTFILKPTEELEDDPGGKVGLIIDVILFWGYPVWDLFDEVRDWYYILKTRYIIWKIRRKLNKIGVDLDNAEDRKEILHELTKEK